MSQRKNPSWVVVCICLGGLISSCSNKEMSRSEGRRISDQPARLIVVNQLGHSMQIYLRSAFGGESYLGRLFPSETRTLLIKPPFPPERSALMARPTQAAIFGEPITINLVEQLRSGDSLRWDLMLNQFDWKRQAPTR